MPDQTNSEDESEEVDFRQEGEHGPHRLSLYQSCAMLELPEMHEKDEPETTCSEKGSAKELPGVTNRDSLYHAYAALNIPAVTDSEDESEEVDDKQEAEDKSHRFSLYQSCAMLELPEEQEDDEPENTCSEGSTTKNMFEVTDRQEDCHEIGLEPLNQPSAMPAGSKESCHNAELRELTDCVGDEEFDHWAHCLKLYKSCAMLEFQEGNGCETKLIEQINVNLNVENGWNDETHCQHEDQFDEVFEGAGEFEDSGEHVNSIFEAKSPQKSGSTPDILGRGFNHEVENGAKRDQVASQPPRRQSCEQVSIAEFGHEDRSEMQHSVSSNEQGVKLSDEKVEVAVPTSSVLVEPTLTNSTKSDASPDLLGNASVEISEGGGRDVENGERRDQVASPLPSNQSCEQLNISVVGQENESEMQRNLPSIKQGTELSDRKVEVAVETSPVLVESILTKSAKAQLKGGDVSNPIMVAGLNIKSDGSPHLLENASRDISKGGGKELENREERDQVASALAPDQSCEQVNIPTSGQDNFERQHSASSIEQGRELSNKKVEAAVETAPVLAESTPTSPAQLKGIEASNAVAAGMNIENDASPELLEDISVGISKGDSGGACRLGDDGNSARPETEDDDTVTCRTQDATKEDGSEKEEQSQRSREEEFGLAAPKEHHFSISLSSSNFFDTNVDAIQFKSMHLDQGCAWHQGNKKQGIRPRHDDERKKSDCNGISSSARTPESRSIVPSQNTEYPKGIVFDSDQDDLMSTITMGNGSLPSFTTHHRPAFKPKTSTSLEKEIAGEDKECSTANARSQAHDIMKDLLDFKSRKADSSRGQSDCQDPQADKLSCCPSASSEQTGSQEGSVGNEPTRFEQELVRLRKRLSSRRQKSAATIDCVESDNSVTSLNVDSQWKVHSDDGVSQGQDKVRELLKKAVQSKRHCTSASTLAMEMSSERKKMGVKSAEQVDHSVNDLQVGTHDDSIATEKSFAPMTSRMVDQWENKFKRNPDIEKKRTRKSLAVGRAETLLKENSALAKSSQPSREEDCKSESREASRVTEYKSLLKHPIQRTDLPRNEQKSATEGINNSPRLQSTLLPEAQMKSQVSPADTESKSQVDLPSNVTSSAKNEGKQSNLLRETSSRRAKLNDKLEFLESVWKAPSVQPSFAQAKHQNSAQQVLGTDSPNCSGNNKSLDATVPENTSFGEEKELANSHMSSPDGASLVQNTNPCIDEGVAGAAPESSSPQEGDVPREGDVPVVREASRMISPADTHLAIEKLHDNPTSVRHRLASKPDDIWAQIAKKANLLGQIGGVSFKTNSFRSVKSKVRKYEKYLLDPEYTVTSSASSKSQLSIAGFPMPAPQPKENENSGSSQRNDDSNAEVDPTPSPEHHILGGGAVHDQTSQFRERGKLLRDNITLSPLKFSRSEIQSVADRIQELEGDDFDGTFSLCSTIKTEDSYINSASVIKTLKITTKDKSEDARAPMIPGQKNQLVSQSRVPSDQEKSLSSPAVGDGKLPSAAVKGGNAERSKKKTFSSFIIRNDEGSMMVSTDQEDSAEDEQQLLEVLLASREDEVSSSNIPNLPKIDSTDPKDLPVVETVSTDEEEEEEDESDSAGNNSRNPSMTPPNDLSAITLLAGNQESASNDPAAASVSAGHSNSANIANVRSSENKLDPDGIKIFTTEESIDFLNNSILDDSFDDDSSGENTLNSGRKQSGTPLMSPLLHSPAMTPLLNSPSLTPLLNSPIMSPLLVSPTRGNSKSVPIEATLTVFRDLVTETLTSWNLPTLFNEESDLPPAPKKVDTSNPELFSVECTLESHSGPALHNEEAINEDATTGPAICRNVQNLSAIDEGQELEPETETPSLLGGESLPIERPGVVSLPSWDETEIAHEQSRAGEENSRCNNATTDPATTRSNEIVALSTATRMMPASPCDAGIAPSKRCPKSMDALMGRAPPLSSIDLKPKKAMKSNHHRSHRKPPKDVSDFPSYFPQRSDSFDVPGSDFGFVNDYRAGGMMPMTASMDEEDSFPQLLGFNAQKQRLSSSFLVGSPSGKKRSKSASR